MFSYFTLVPWFVPRSSWLFLCFLAKKVPPTQFTLGFHIHKGQIGTLSMYVKKKISISSTTMFCRLWRFSELLLIPWNINCALFGMLHHSLATLEGEWEFVVFYRVLLCLWCSPPSLSLCPSLHSLFFFLGGCMHACKPKVQWIAISACTGRVF